LTFWANSMESLNAEMLVRQRGNFREGLNFDCRATVYI
jgi:hypothetical protein